MFLLIAEATGLYELLTAPALKGTIFQALGLQFQHHPWNGLRLWDLGKPSFMFISGVAMFFSYSGRMQRGEAWSESLVHALRRSLLLFAFGWAIYRIVPAEGGPSGAFLYDVLPQLAFASLLSFLVIRCRPLWQVLLASGLLAITEICYRLLAPPGFEHPFIPGRNFGSYLDSLFLGGASAEHWVAFNIVPSSALVIWGSLIGRWLRAPGKKFLKDTAMFALGLAGVICGLALSPVTPIIRRISTSTFVVMCGGFCLMALALARWLMRMKMIMIGASFFLVVGMNPLFIYLFAQMGGADWLRAIVKPFIFGFLFASGGLKAELASSLAALGLMWALCAWLYRRRILLRL